MCGIIGYCGSNDTAPILLNGLSKLEYRGYDSAGIALLHEGSSIETIKTTGKVQELRNKVDSLSPTTSHCGIGHTRWATHGKVTDVNAHPHTSGAVTLIHNGIIENYASIAARLSEYGLSPRSQTDSEIAAMLISHFYDGDPIKAIKKAVEHLEGAYAFCILFSDQKDVIYCVRNASPLVAVRDESGSYIASDMTALIEYSKEYFIVPEQHIAKLTKDAIELMDLDGNAVEPTMLVAPFSASSAQKNGYDHYMLKEIHEQPEAITTTIRSRLNGQQISFAEDEIPDSLFEDFSKIIITACGTAFNAGLVGKSIFEQLLRIPVSVETASEFRYGDPILDEKTLVIIISQSGETADSLAALRLAKERGAKTLSIVNVKGSSIAMESDFVLYTHAGPEIAVASTKAFTVQVAALYLLCGKVAEVRNLFTKEQQENFLKQLLQIPELINESLQLEPQLKELSNMLTDATDSFFIGRGVDYALSCEGSLKLKEISYIHSEAYMAGELKHGPISLITQQVPVIAISTKKETFPKMVSNMQEVKARGASVLLITDQEEDVTADTADFVLKLPAADIFFSVFSVSVAVQLLAYYASVSRDLDVDQPRNLAKSVTVE